MRTLGSSARPAARRRRACRLRDTGSTPSHRCRSSERYRCGPPRRPVVALRSALACAPLVEGADVAVGTGGYASVPAILAARRAHVPIVLHEPNARPGLANRMLARFASAIGVAFEDVGNGWRGHARIEVIGYPVREAIIHVAGHREELAEEASRRAGSGRRAEGRCSYGEGARVRCTSTRSSRRRLPRLASDEHLQLLVLTGPANLSVVAIAAERATGVRVRALPFLGAHGAARSRRPTWRFRGRAPRRSPSRPYAACRRSWSRTRTRPRTIRRRTLASSSAWAPRAWCSTPISPPRSSSTG